MGHRQRHRSPSSAPPAASGASHTHTHTHDSGHTKYPLASRTQRVVVSRRPSSRTNLSELTFPLQSLLPAHLSLSPLEAALVAEHGLDLGVVRVDLADRLRVAASPGDRLFPYTYYFVRTRFRDALRRLGLTPGRYVFHSLRHVGATRLFESGAPIDSIAHRGRWAALQSARRYIQQGLALLVQTRIAPERLARARALARSWPWRISA